MIVRGVVRNGVVVPDPPTELPEGAEIWFDVGPALENDPSSAIRRVREGGWLKGRVEIAPDFDELPLDIRVAFGMDST